LKLRHKASRGLSATAELLVSRRTRPKTALWYFILQGEQGEHGTKGDKGEAGLPGKNVSELFHSFLLFFFLLFHGNCKIIALI